MSTDKKPGAAEQINAARATLTEQLLRKQRLARDLKTCDEQIEALTNFIAGAEIGAKDIIERAQRAEDAKKAAAAAAPDVIGTAKVGDQIIPLIDDTAPQT